MEYDFEAELWLYDGNGAWHFLTLPKDISKDIRSLFGHKRPGWGSIRVTASVGNTSWKTSIFPDKKTGSYLLPVKSEVRKSAGIAVGEMVKTKIKLHP